MVVLPFLEMWTFEILLSRGIQLLRNWSFGCLVSEALIHDFMRSCFLENLKFWEVGPILIGFEDLSLDSVIFRWSDSLDIGLLGSSRVGNVLFRVESLRSWSFDVRIVGTLKSWDMRLPIDDLLMKDGSRDIGSLRVDFGDRFFWTDRFLRWSSLDDVILSKLLSKDGKTFWVNDNLMSENVWRWSLDDWVDLIEWLESCNDWILRVKFWGSYLFDVWILET